MGFWKNKNKIYKLLLNGTDCGPFDGGCVVFAEALKKAYGGRVMVLVGNGIAQHAVLELDGLLIDADGPLDPERFIKRFEKNELCKITGYREMRTGYDPNKGYEDLPGTPRDDALSSKIAKLLKTK